ncbi:MAG: NAD(P)H-hydrate dehydratase [Clostridiales bacterium]|nr:NAD(P)H-hydrate dehydratase [Clostridiales bacterium]
MRKADIVSINDYNIPGIVLMENAALGIVNEIEKELNNGKLPQEVHACIICGTGNNGGDGFAVARHLVSKSWHVEVYICGDVNKIKGDALINLNIIKKLNIPIYCMEDCGIEVLDKILIKSDLIVDGILGTGFKGKLKSNIETIIEKINKQQKFVISIDNPTGLNCDTGLVETICIKANKTVTLGLPKIGLIINEGPHYCGELSVCGLSIPDPVYESLGIKRYMTQEDYIKNLIKPRKLHSHKGSFGRVLIAAGSKGMEGAALLAARAAIRSGAGIVELAVPQGAFEAVRGAIPTLITNGLDDDGEGCFTDESIEEILSTSEKASVLLMGPGIRNNPHTKEVVSEVITKCHKPLILDADGLNAICQIPEVLLERPEETIITPHPGEMARLLNTSTVEVQNNRLETAESFAKKYNVHVVLKGHRTIIASPLGETWINTTGNPGMATAGSGDVLGGVIASFIAQGMEPMKAAISGVYIHGAAGDRAAEKYGQWGMVATDIIKYIPHTIMDIGGM